jgi:hypothetical protein
MTIQKTYLGSTKNKKIEITLLPAAAIITAVILSAVPMFAFAEEGRADNNDKEVAVEQMVRMEDGKKDAADLISSITEWVGIAALGMTTGLVISSTGRMRKTVFVSTAVLSFAVGIIHLLLVKEHSAESSIWGIGFLVMGVSQIIYGIVMVFAKTLLPMASIKRLFCEIGIAGNALFVGIFVLARITGIFSPDGTPVNELEPNGIMTVVIELLIVALLSYLVKDKKEKQELEDLIHLNSNRRKEI